MNERVSSSQVNNDQQQNRTSRYDNGKSILKNNSGKIAGVVGGGAVVAMAVAAFASSGQKSTGIPPSPFGVPVGGYMPGTQPQNNTGVLGSLSQMASNVFGGQQKSTGIPPNPIDSMIPMQNNPFQLNNSRVNSFLG